MDNVTPLIDEMIRTRFTDRTDYQLQANCMAAELGEFIGALNRWQGKVRRPGSFQDVADELADVGITSYTMASLLGLDYPSIIKYKLRIVMERPWQE